MHKGGERGRRGLLMYPIHDSRGMGGCLAYTPHLKKSLAYTPPPPKTNFGPKMGKFGQKIAFFGNFLTNPPDFYKSSVKFHEMF
jgi:hypothetical protein